MNLFVDIDVTRQRLTQRQKNANGHRYYKAQIDSLDHLSFSDSRFIGYGGVSEYTRKKVNYDLFNNILNPKDLEYVCKPFGDVVGELPAQMTNRDIVSGKIKVLLGMEMKMPFSWKVVAVNEEATTRKEKHEFGMITDYVTSEIMKPIRAKLEQQEAEQTKGQQLTPEEQQQLKAQIDEQTKQQTPEEVRKYMKREHQDPAEAMAHQLLEYLILKERVSDKFNKGFKHSLLSGEEIYHVGVFNGEPGVSVVNSLYFDYDRSPDLDFIEDGEWAVCEYRMTPSEVISKLGSQLTEDEIDEIYTNHNNPISVSAADFDFASDRVNDGNTIRVLHGVWKSLMRVGFLSYLDRSGKEQLKLVGEDYKLKKSEGDLDIQWEWIPETHETWKIGSDIYVNCRPVPGQNKDLDNLYSAKLPYYGAAVDNLNSPSVSPMDRMKAYQYYYNIILYRIELLMASDKGKILMMNIKAIPKSAGINTNKFIYFMEANKIGFYNPMEEGNKNGGQDAGSIAKEIDMSLASDIQKYIQMAEYIETKCGACIGVTKQMEGAISPNEAVTNTRQNLQQSSHIIQPYYELHNIVKGNVLKALLETSKVAYASSKPRKLSYVLDDMSLQMLNLDSALLDSNTYGLFISNSTKADEAKQAVIQLSQAALQNQQADLSDIIKIIRSESIQEAEELLEASVDRKAEEAQAANEAKIRDEQEARKAAAQEKEADRKHEADMIVLKETEKRKTDIQKQAMLSIGFDPNKDEDEDGVLDVLEVAKFGVDADIKKSKQQLDRDRFEHDKEQDAAKNKLDSQKIQIQKQKINNN